MAGTSESSSSGGKYPGWPEDVRTAPTQGRKRRRKRRDSGSETALSINSLMDIVTIILVYLIKSFATSPIDVQDPALDIPASNSLEAVEEGVVVMITGPVKKVLEPGSKQASLVANQPLLAVDDRKLFGLNQVTGADGKPSWRVPAAQKAKKVDTDFVVTELRNALIKAKELQETVASQLDADFTGKVVILADKRTPYRVLMDVLVTCGQAGFGEFRFAILKSG